jgi:flagellar hook-associated protein 3 FlgL
MSGIRHVYARTTPLLLSNQLYSKLRQTQSEMLQRQKEITTGKTVIRPSDEPARVSGIQFLNQQLAARAQHERNIEHALSVLNNTDAAIADATSLLREATAIASSQIGIGSDTTTRATQAEVIAAQIEALIDIGNRQFNQVSLFGGKAGAAANGVIFDEFLGGVRYRGAADNLLADVGGLKYEPFTSNGLDAFGALSSRVKSIVNLQPLPTADTRLADIGGALGEGVRKGVVVVSVNGTPTSVDLNTADTLGDVMTRINAAIDTVAPGGAAITLAGEGFVLTDDGATSVTISEVGNGKTAGDLGIRITSSPAPGTAGTPVAPRLTPTTPLADLGAAVDWASGMSITHGEVTKVADFSSAQTVEDLINVIEDLNLGLRLQINTDATGLDLISEVSGIRLSIGENGGTTAADLGLRTMGVDTLLSDFRDGVGVEGVTGEPDFRITLHSGVAIDVNIDGARSVGELIAAIEAAAVAAGVTPGVDFSVGLAAVGNGLVFTDGTAGPNHFRVENLGLSLAADHLGITQNAGAGSTITGEDTSTVRTQSVFTHLIDLRNALKQDDTRGITLAGSRLETDLDSLTQAHARVGVNAKRLEDQKMRAEDMTLMEKSMLSDLQDADLTEVITRFTQLQMQLQASLQVGAQNLQMNLLDFLR